MQYIIQAPSKINASIALPASKSISNRALIIRALSADAPTLDNVAHCDDTDVMVRALQSHDEVIDIMASGTAMRFLTAYFSVTPGTHIITGTDRMKQRPIGVLVHALRKLGAKITYTENEGFPPLRIEGGTIQGGTLEMAGNVSSQYITALMLIAPTLPQGLRIKLVNHIVSRPYIDLTMHLLHEFGAQAEWADDHEIWIPHCRYHRERYHVENDWTAVSYWYEMLTLLSNEASELRFGGLSDNSRQGDAAVRRLFSLLGITTKISGEGQGAQMKLTNRGRQVSRIDYDFTNQPDLVQTLVVTCVARGVHFCFKGLESLHIKETDRVHALRNELLKVGYVLHEPDEGTLEWNGERCDPQPDPAFDTYNDHRMAMALAPLAITLGEIRINNPEVVSKSYPLFWNQLRQVGFTITEV